MKLGIELPEAVKVAVARDEASGEDHVNVQGSSFETVLRFDADGRLIPSEEDPGTFASRAYSGDAAMECCWTGAHPGPARSARVPALKAMIDASRLISQQQMAFLMDIYSAMRRTVSSQAASGLVPMPGTATGNG